MRQRLTPEPGDIYRVELSEKSKIGSVSKVSGMVTHAASQQEIAEQMLWFLEHGSFVDSPEFGNIIVTITKVANEMPFSSGEIHPDHLAIN